MDKLDFSFSHPYVLLLLEIIPVMFLYYFQYYRKQRSIIQISTLAGFKNYEKTFRQKLIHLPFILRCLAIFSLIIAMADPKTVKYQLAKDPNPGETVFLMDISQNSLAKDFLPNRIISLKRVLDHYLDSHPNTSFGIVTMGKQINTLVPITGDIQTLKKNLDELETENCSGIHLEEGLKAAADNFIGSESHHKQIFIFLSSNIYSQNPTALGHYLGLKDSISIYPLVLASEGLASYPQIRLRDTLYTERIIDIPETPLRILADNTGGLFFRCQNNQELDKNFLKLNDNLERLKTNRNPNYQGILPFAWIAFFLLVLEIIARYTFLKSLP